MKNFAESRATGDVIISKHSARARAAFGPSVGRAGESGEAWRYECRSRDNQPGACAVRT